MSSWVPMTASVCLLSFASSCAIILPWSLIVASSWYWDVNIHPVVFAVAGAGAPCALCLAACRMTYNVL